MKSRLLQAFKLKMQDVCGRVCVLCVCVHVCVYVRMCVCVCHTCAT